MCDAAEATSAKIRTGEASRSGHAKGSAGLLPKKRSPSPKQRFEHLVTSFSVHCRREELDVVHAASELQALLSNVPDAPCLKRFEMEGLRFEPGSLLAPVLPGAFLCRLRFSITHDCTHWDPKRILGSYVAVSIGKLRSLFAYVAFSSPVTWSSARRRRSEMASLPVRSLRGCGSHSAFLFQKLGLFRNVGLRSAARTTHSSHSGRRTFAVLKPQGRQRPLAAHCVRFRTCSATPA